MQGKSRNGWQAPSTPKQIEIVDGEWDGRLSGLKKNTLLVWVLWPGPDLEGGKQTSGLVGPDLQGLIINQGHLALISRGL